MTSPKKRSGTTKPGRSGTAIADRRIAFARAFVANLGNQTQAAVAAGFSPKSARQQGARMLANAAVVAEIERLRAQVVEKAEALHDITLDRLLSSCSAAINLDPTRIFAAGKMLPPAQWPLDVRQCIQGLEFDAKGNTIKVRFLERNTARDQAARMIGAYEKDHKNLTDPLNALIAELMKRPSALPIAPA